LSHIGISSNQLICHQLLCLQMTHFIPHLS